jgi:hypothetical protein
VRSKLKKGDTVHDTYDKRKEHKRRDRDEKQYGDAAADDVVSGVAEQSKSSSKL